MKQAAKAKKNRGQWQPGTSGNPAGRPTKKSADGSVFGGAFSGDMTMSNVPPETKQAGSDGVASPGGFLLSSERDPRLRNREKWITYDDATLNTAIVASAMRIWLDLGSSAKWHCEPNARGGKDADRGVEIIEQGLFESQMSKPWRSVVRKQLLKKHRGFALHEVLPRRRSDGMWICGDIQHRPQWTVFRWLKPDEFTSWIGIQQLTRMGAMPYIPRERLFYSVEDALTDSPDGVGLLRHIAELARVRQVYLNLEGIGLQTDLAGMPVGRAPLAELRRQARSEGMKTDAEIASYVEGAVQFLDDFLRKHNKTPDQSLLLDSSPYRGKGADAGPSSVMQWAIDVVRSATNIAPVSASIARLDREMARVMCAEWLLLGSGDSGGAYSMHEDKTAMFGMTINSALQDIADDARRDIAARLIALNGLDPELATPTLIPEPVAVESALDTCRALATLATAALHPRDKAIEIIRDRMKLPPPPPIDDGYLMLPRGVVVVPESDPTLATPDGVGAAGADKQPKKPESANAPEADGKPGNVNAQPKKRRR